MHDAGQPKILAKLFGFQLQALRRAKNRGRAPVVCQLIESTKQFEAVASGHLIVRHDKIDAAADQAGVPSLSIAGGFDMKSGVGSRKLKDASKDGIVLDDQHGRRDGHESEFWSANSIELVRRRIFKRPRGAKKAGRFDPPASDVARL